MDLQVLPDYMTRTALNTLPASEHLSFPLRGAPGHLSSARDFRETHRSYHPLEPLGNILPAGSSIGFLGPLSTRSRSVDRLKVTSQERTEVSRRNSIVIFRLLRTDVMELFAELFERSYGLRSGLAIIPQRCHFECQIPATFLSPPAEAWWRSRLLRLHRCNGVDRRFR
jgi:hypothetical protein